MVQKCERTAFSFDIFSTFKFIFLDNYWLAFLPQVLNLKLFVPGDLCSLNDIEFLLFSNSYYFLDNGLIPSTKFPIEMFLLIWAVSILLLRLNLNSRKRLEVFSSWNQPDFQIRFTPKQVTCFLSLSSQSKIPALVGVLQRKFCFFFTGAASFRTIHSRNCYQSWHTSIFKLLCLSALFAKVFVQCAYRSRFWKSEVLNSKKAIRFW